MSLAEVGEETERRPAHVVGKVCGQCMFWDPYVSGPAYGECRRVGNGLDNLPMAAIVAPESVREPVLTTRAMFGCFLWEPLR